MRQPANSCCTRWTNKFVAANRKVWSTKYEFWDFLGPMLDDYGSLPRRRRPRHGLDGDPRLSRRRGRRGDGRLRFDLRSQHDERVLHRQCRESLFSGGCQIRQRRIHPGAPDGDSRQRQAAFDERIGSRRRGPRLGAPKTARPACPATIPESERYYFLEERYPEYGNLVPRDIATREIFDICVNEG